MKNFKLSLAYLAVFAMIFTSCSKEETAVSGLDGQDTYQLQFGANLNDFNKQQTPVECRDAAPAYVLVALTDSNDDWVADKNPEAPGADAGDFIRINLKNNNGSWETEYSDELGLPAGTYQLEYFIVYSADNEVLWVAPREGSAFAASVDNPLPQAIVLGAGTKPYIEVDVLCFIPREEEAYGYIFFDINLVEVENNYCIFVNYCDDETGREYPALFEVDVWGDAFGGSEVIIDGEMNSVSGAGNSFAATVLCLPLPPLGEGELYYVRVTVLSAGAYDADASDFYEYTISQNDINLQLSQTPRYEHIRINCGEPQGEPFCTNDDLDDSLCDFYCTGGIYGFLSESGDVSSDEFIYITPGNFGDTFKLYVDGTTTKIADVEFAFNMGGDLRVIFSDVQGTITAFAIDARLPASSVAELCRDIRCMPDCEFNDDFTERLERDVITPTVLANGGFYIKIRAQQGNCPSS